MASSCVASRYLAQVLCSAMRAQTRLASTARSAGLSLLPTTLGTAVGRCALRDAGDGQPLRRRDDGQKGAASPSSGLPQVWRGMHPN
eukprot:782943-Pyramimonas_sp.AAC.1